MKRESVVESLRGPGRCPAPAELGEYLEGRSLHLREHLSACSQCQAELALMREMLSGEPQAAESADVRWVAKRIRPVTGGEMAAEPSWRNWFRLAPVLATLLVVVSVGMYLRRPVEPGEVRYSGAGELRSARVAIVGPVGVLAARPAEFAWEAVAGASGYEVTVEEVSGDLVWKGRAAQSPLAAPAGVTAKMLPGKTLLWRVAAFDGQGATLAESEMTKFRMEPPK